MIRYHLYHMVRRHRYQHCISADAISYVNKHKECAPHLSFAQTHKNCKSSVYWQFLILKPSDDVNGTCERHTTTRTKMSANVLKWTKVFKDSVVCKVFLLPLEKFFFLTFLLVMLSHELSM